METLDEYNRRMGQRQAYIQATAHLARVACPKCKTEMHVTNPGMVLCSMPPQRDVHCPACGHRDYQTC